MSEQKQQKPLTAIEKVERSFDAGKTSLMELAGKTAPFDFDRVKRIVVSALRRDPKLAACTPESIVQSVQDAVRLGLEPNGPQGHCYLVPYKDKCQLILGYRGLIALARRSGEILSIEAHIIYENDQYDVSFGSDPHIVHKPNLRGDRGAPLAAYAIAKLAGGGVQSDVMRIDEIDKIMLASPSKGGYGPWADFRGEMQRKTAIRRLAKTLPMSVALADQLDAEDRGEVDVTHLDKRNRKESPALPPSMPAETFASEGAASEFAAIVGNDADPFAVAEGIAKGWAADPSIAKPAPVEVKVAPVVVEAPAASSPEADLLRERIEGMDSPDDYKDIADDLKAAKARATNAMPKETYDNLASALVAKRDALKKGGGK
jgi:recombination protein RecT